MVQGYCVKCKTKRDMKGPYQSKSKKGTPMTCGICPNCGTKMCRMGST